MFKPLVQEGSTFTTKSICYAMMGAAYAGIGDEAKAKAAYEKSR